jgi:hypothetical protein
MSAGFDEGLDVIGVGAFWGCSSLGIVYLPESLNAVYENAFIGCESLSYVVYDGTLEKYMSIRVDAGNEYLDMAALESLS